MELGRVDSALRSEDGESLCLWSEAVSEFPGYVRTVYARSRCRVAVEYEVFGLDEGGIYLVGAYPSPEAAIRCLEQFANNEVAEWSGEDWLHERPVGALEAGHEALRQALRRGGVPVPAGARFELRGSSYWEQFLE